MKDLFWDFLKSLYEDVPSFVYNGLFFVFCVASVVVVSVKGLKKGWGVISLITLTEYLFLMYCSTVFFRPYKEEIGSNFIPFWSYYAFDKANRPDLLPENVMNFIVFVPIGLLLGCAFRKILWWKVFLIGGAVSISIEALQFFYKRGFAETDDVMHNVLGCMFGYGIYILIRLGYDKVTKRRGVIL